MAIKQFLTKAKKLQEQQHHPRKVEEKRSEAPMHDESNWLVSYADMMTLLCGFFIMLFSMAHLDEKQYEKVKESMAKEFKGAYKAPAEDTAKFVTQVIQSMGIEKDASIRTDTSGVAVTFESTLFFDTLSSDVKSEGNRILDKLITGISEHQKTENKKYRVVVEGHTDSRPITGGAYPSNWELSAARSAKVVRMFLERGFTPDHLTAIGYADTYPVAEPRFPNGTYNDEALAKNRRVVVRIMEPKTEAIPFPEVTAPSLRAPASVVGTVSPPTPPRPELIEPRKATLPRPTVELPGGPSPNLPLPTATPYVIKPVVVPAAVAITPVVMPVVNAPAPVVVPPALATPPPPGSSPLSATPAH